MKGRRISSLTILLVALLAICIVPPSTFGNSDDLIPGIIQDYVDVYRDEYGVPHIYAQSISDAYFALGYVMAEDRLFQMDLFRRTAAGRLSEIFGDSTLEIDVLMRTLGIYQIAVDTWNGLYPDCIIPSDIKQNLEQFAKGVNRYIADMVIPDDVPLEYRALSLATGLPVEYFIPYPWTPPDSIAVAGLMGIMLTDTSGEEIIKGAFSAMVDPIYEAYGLPGMSDFLMPISGVNMTIINPPDPPLVNLERIEDITAPLKRFLGFYGFEGSNNWVISGLNTTTGNSMLANDPHLNLQAPGINWQVHINVPGWGNVIGVCIPGGPVIYSGHNDYIAFGVTNLMADVLDLYYYVSNETHYYYVDHWEPFNVEMVTIYNFVYPITIPVVSTRHGPIVSTPLPPPFDKMAVRWNGKESGYGEIVGFSLVMNATNLSEWKQAVSYMSVIIQNYVYADKSGNIAWCPSGKIPLRPPPPPAGTGTLGVVPSNGSAGQNEWMGWLPHATNPVDYPFDPWPGEVSLPYVENPKQGFIVTANNQPIGPEYFGYPWPIWIGPSFGFAPGYRAQRITELIEALSPISMEDMKAIQSDIVSIPARNIVPILLAVMATDTNETIQNALTVLATWNYSELRGLVAPLIWEVFLEKFAENTFGDELWAAMGLYPFPNMIIPLWNMTQTWSWNPYALALFDDQRTSEFELMPQIMNKSLRDALNWIASQLGPPADAAFSNWEYGNLHVVMFEHTMGEQIGYLNVPPIPVGCDGGPFTVNPGRFYHRTLSDTEVLYVDSGASYRGIYECKDGWDTSLILVPPGESGSVTGHPMVPKFSPHYGDTFLMWLNYEYTPCLFNDAIIQTFPKTTFYPAIHNIAVTDITLSTIAIGTIVQVYVTIENEGIMEETFTVTLYYDSNEIGSYTVTQLAPQTTEQIVFDWDTTGLTPGEYNITAVATPVPDEVHLIDNTKSIIVRAGVPPRVEVEPAIYDAQLLNKVFKVNLTINNLDEQWRAVALQFRLCYNNTLLEVINVTEGPFMQDPRWNLYGTFFTCSIEEDPIYGPNILVGLMLYPNETGHWTAFPSGSGVLVTITFKAIYQERGLEKPPQVCGLTLNDTIILDDEVNPIPLTLQHGLYRMHPTHIGDFNYDGAVDIIDIASAALAFGSYPGHDRWDPLYDTNNDGKIDMLDLATTALGFGWRITFDP
jgi:penicillin amidase